MRLFDLASRASNRIILKWTHYTKFLICFIFRSNDNKEKKNIKESKDENSLFITKNQDVQKLESISILIQYTYFVFKKSYNIIPWKKVKQARKTIAQDGEVIYRENTIHEYTAISEQANEVHGL